MEKIIKRYKDFYGGSASIRVTKENAVRLIVCDGYGKRVVDKVYATERGARVAMGKASDGWRECK